VQAPIRVVPLWYSMVGALLLAAVVANSAASIYYTETGARFPSLVFGGIMIGLDVGIIVFALGYRSYRENIGSAPLQLA